MVSKPRIWWQKIKHHWVAIGVVVIVLLTVLALIIIGYSFNWTGFNGYNKISTVRIVNSSSGTVTRTEEFQPGKTLWDWLQLLAALAIPAVVGLGVAWFTTKFNEQQSQTEHE